MKLKYKHVNYDNDKKNNKTDIVRYFNFYAR